jgi:CDP-4-dehydro-6-deoxyglucose reductase
MSLISTLNGKHFKAESNETLLDAALRANVILEHSCKTGRCGSCKTKVAVGSTMAIMDESGLTLREKLSGWILTCARSAVDDVQLSVEDLGDFQLSPPKTYPCRIQSLEKLAPDVLKVVLRLPPQQQFAYLPGQYVDMIGPGGMRRSYSMANALSAEKCIELHIRQVPDGAMSQYWFEQAKPNDLLRLNGPLGTFFLRDVAGLDLVFLATGTGIAPVKAMLEGLARVAEHSRPRSITVYWGGRTAQDLYWNPVATSVEHRFIPALSRPDAGWAGVRGHVHQALMTDKPLLSQTVVYACGSDAMIHSARQVLTAAGLPERRFHSDAFVPSSHNLTK